MQDWFAFVSNAGLAVALAVYFTWQSKLREQRLEDQNNKLGEYIRDELTGLVKENQRVMSELKVVIESRLESHAER